MKTTNRFAIGSGCYRCRCCDRRTRSTGNGDNENVLLCEQCFDLAGYENAVQDGEVLSENEKSNVKTLIERVVALGGRDTWSYATFGI